MSTVYAFINQKGGVSKTTSAVNVGAALAIRGYRVLLIDLDPQGSLSVSTGYGDTTDLYTTYDVLKEKAEIVDAIQHKTDAVKPYDVMPTDIRLSGVDLELAAVPARELILKEAVAKIRQSYDYIFIDCPPSLGLLTVMGLTACDSVIIPVQSQYLALNGMSQLLNTVDIVKKRLNPQLEIMGVIITFYDGRQTLDREVLAQVSQAFPDKVFDTKLRKNVKLAEAPTFGKDIFAYDRRSLGAQQYEELAIEIENRGK